MENREIIVANTKTQKRNKIVTNATTLAELKAAFNDAGIDYSGMTFTEGISKTQLLDDATQLPQNVMYKGQPTNNLVILLTNTKKNIASGIHAADRQAAYSIIKERGFQEEIKEVFGRNFTQVSTADLQNFIEDRTESDADDLDEDEYDYEDEDGVNGGSDYDEDSNSTFEPTQGNKYAQCTIGTTLCLFDLGVVTPEDISYIIDNLKNALKNVSKPVSTSDGSINDDDIDTMLDELNM